MGSWGNDKNDKGVFAKWSYPILHRIGDRLEDGKTEKTYKQIGRILKYGDIPDQPGIYLFRSRDDTTNYYCGQTHYQTLRKRLAQHLTGESGKLKRGEEYTIRCIVSQDPCLAEAIAIIYFHPERNEGNDWKAAIRRKNAKTILNEAKRLGLYSQQDQELFCLKLLEYISSSV